MTIPSKLDLPAVTQAPSGKGRTKSKELVTTAVALTETKKGKTVKSTLRLKGDGTVTWEAPTESLLAELIGKWSKPIDQLPVYIDLPRLANKIVVEIGVRRQFRKFDRVGSGEGHGLGASSGSMPILIKGRSGTNGSSYSSSPKGSPSRALLTAGASSPSPDKSGNKKEKDQKKIQKEIEKEQKKKEKEDKKLKEKEEKSKKEKEKETKKEKKEKGPGMIWWSIIF